MFSKIKEIRQAIKTYNLHKQVELIELQDKDVLIVKLDHAPASEEQRALQQAMLTVAKSIGVNFKTMLIANGVQAGMTFSILRKKSNIEAEVI